MVVEENERSITNLLRRRRHKYDVEDIVRPFSDLGLSTRIIECRMGVVPSDLALVILWWRPLSGTLSTLGEAARGVGILLRWRCAVRWHVSTSVRLFAYAVT